MTLPPDWWDNQPTRVFPPQRPLDACPDCTEGWAWCDDGYLSLIRCPTCQGTGKKTEAGVAKVSPIPEDELEQKLADAVRRRRLEGK